MGYVDITNFMNIFYVNEYLVRGEIVDFIGLKSEPRAPRFWVQG